MPKKEKVAFCSQDAEYKERFVRCFMHHYKGVYELHAFGNLEDLLESEKGTYSILVVDACPEVEKKLDYANYGRIIVLHESGEEMPEESSEEVMHEEKYQEVYKIKSAIDRALYQQGGFRNAANECKITGVFSLGYENQQYSICTLLASEYAKKRKTLIINLQPYSGYEESSIEADFSLEDLLLSTEYRDDAKGRIVGAIGHGENWDFVYSVKNTECLSEMNDSMYQSVLKVVTQELGYEHVIINFGAVFTGMYSLMVSCDRFFLLVNNLEEKEYREEQYLRELAQKGYEIFAEKISRIQIPRGKLGDQVRKYIWGE